VFQTISSTLAILPMETPRLTIAEIAKMRFVKFPDTWLFSKYRPPPHRKCIESYGKLHAYIMRYRIQWEIQLMNMHEPPEKYK